MASDSYPRPDFNGGEVTELLYERLASVQAPDGLIGNPVSYDPLVYADGLGTRQVKVRANRRALVRGFMYDSGPEEIALTLPANTSGTTRIDLVVLRLTRSSWRVQETFIEGTPGAGQPAPVQQLDTGVWDLPLAAVTVAHNAGPLASGTVVPLAWYLGPDGQMVCTTSTRPPHERFRRIGESDTGQALISNGTSWLPVGGDASGSIAAATGFTHANQVLRRRNGHVTFALTIWRPAAQLTANTEYRVGTIAAGFRPLAQVPSVGICPSMQSVLSCSVNTDGAVLINPGATSIPANRAVILASITYPTLV